MAENDLVIKEGAGFQEGDLHIFTELESTNTYLVNRVGDHMDGDVVQAKRQTHGRGRGDRIWLSPGDHNLTFSILHRAPKNKDIWPNISQAACLAMAQLLDKIHPDITIKWPNDLLYKKKKIAGILTEVISRDDGNWLVLGIGLNVNTNTADLTQLNTQACSLSSVTGKTFHIPKLLKDFLGYYSLIFQKLLNNGFGDLIQEWQKYFTFKGELAEHRQGSKLNQVRIKKILPDGSLEAAQNGQTVVLKWGEITLL